MLGGHARVIAEIVHKNNDKLIGMLDDNQTGENIIGKVCDIEKIYNNDTDIEFIIAIGNNSIRNEIYKEYTNLINYTAIHPTSVISDTAKIGKGTVIGANAVINANSIVKGNCIINTGTIIEHDCYVEEGAHLSYRVTIGAGTKIGKMAYIEAGVLVDRNIQIKQNEHIIMGSIIRGN